MTGPVIRELTDEEAWKLLRHAPLGRLAVSVRGDVDIFPINFVVDEGDLLFRTAPGTKLVELTINESVALEVDTYTYDEASSVVVKGIAEQLQLQSEIDAADRLPLVPWIPTLKYRWVRIVPTSVRGLVFQRAAEPARY